MSWASEDCLLPSPLTPVTKATGNVPHVPPSPISEWRVRGSAQTVMSLPCPSHSAQAGIRALETQTLRTAVSTESDFASTKESQTRVTLPTCSRPFQKKVPAPTFI